MGSEEFSLFFVFLLFSPFFFSFLREGQGQSTAIYCHNGNFSPTPSALTPCKTFRQNLDCNLAIFDQNGHFDQFGPVHYLAIPLPLLNGARFMGVHLRHPLRSGCFRGTRVDNALSLEGLLIINQAALQGVAFTGV